MPTRLPAGLPAAACGRWSRSRGCSAKAASRSGPFPRERRSTCCRTSISSSAAKLLALLLRAKGDLEALPAERHRRAARSGFADLVEPLLEISKCPDFVVNRGHYFGTDYFAEERRLSDADKRALIAFLKTL